ncbi:MAG: hypothetical protein AAGA58_00835 [Verrucomicrobiota bacterium]
MNEIVLIHSAQADLLEIYSRHGEKIYNHVDRELEVIRNMPEIAPVYHDHFRRKLVHGTPFGIFFTITGNRLMVSFVMDLRQDPAAILKRLQSGR